MSARERQKQRGGEGREGGEGKRKEGDRERSVFSRILLKAE